MAKILTKEDRENIAKWAKEQGLGKPLSREEHLKLVKGKKIIIHDCEDIRIKGGKQDGKGNNMCK